MVAHSGIANDATGSEVPDLIDCRSVTGIVAADDARARDAELARREGLSGLAEKASRPQD